MINLHTPNGLSVEVPETEAEDNTHALHAIAESHKFLQLHSPRLSDMPTNELEYSLIYRPKDQKKFKNQLVLSMETYFPGIFYWIKKQAIKSLIKKNI